MGLSERIQGRLQGTREALSYASDLARRLPLGDSRYSPGRLINEHSFPVGLDVIQRTDSSEVEMLPGSLFVSRRSQVAESVQDEPKTESTLVIKDTRVSMKVHESTESDADQGNQEPKRRVRIVSQYAGGSLSAHLLPGQDGFGYMSNKNKTIPYESKSFTAFRPSEDASNSKE